MRWSKFAELAATHLNLGPCLDWHIRPPVLYSNLTLQAWVEQNVAFVVIRPFQSLDIRSRPAEGTQHVVWHHIGNEEAKCSRARAVGWDAGVRSVRQLMAHLAGWHSEYCAKMPDRPLVFDAVVRHTRRQTLGDYREHIEIYLVPDGFQLQ